MISLHFINLYLWNKQEIGFYFVRLEIEQIKGCYSNLGDRCLRMMDIWTKLLAVEIERRQISGTLKKIKKNEWKLFQEVDELVHSHIIPGEIEP